MKIAILIIGIAAILVIALRMAFRLPKVPIAKSFPLNSAPASPPSWLPKTLETSEGQSAFHPLGEGTSAFAARMMLVDLAQHTIDVQYYIWHADLTGLLLLERLKSAADRGVKVRLLLDDNGIDGLDPILAELNDHPSICVRLYNPFVIRRPKLFNHAFDFLRLNRRMHNKSITIDRSVSITGGRNIGDEYFDTGSQPAFIDLDVIVAGHAAKAIAEDFLRYWSSRPSHPFAGIVSSPGKPSGAFGKALQEAKGSPQYSSFVSQVENDPVSRRLAAGELEFEVTGATLVSDAPDKTLGKTAAGGLMVERLAALLDEVRDEFDLVSPYFVPGRRGVREFLRLAQRGTRVRVLTNSLEANDVALVHAGYSKYRRQLLRGGVELYELKASSAPTVRRSDAGRIGSNATSLHAKTFSADRQRIFIGSFNFDPRSVYLNTEMGLLLDSPTMARRLHERLDDELDHVAYRVSLTSDGALHWEDRQSGKIHTVDPNSGFAKRAIIRMAGWLPIEWLL